MKFLVTLKKRLVFLELRILRSVAVKPFAKRTVAVGTDNSRMGVRLLWMAVIKRLRYAICAVIAVSRKSDNFSLLILLDGIGESL
jgi:hypothetical protein